MNKELLTTEVQEFIDANLHSDINKLLLGKSPFPGITTKELAQQIDSKKRSEKKLPTWFNTSGIYFPPKLNIEQASSEPTARYKAELIRGNSLADLTGGFGVDDYFFSKRSNEVVHIELNAELSAIAQHNAAILGADNIKFLNEDSIEFLRQENQHFDTIYVDPARRLQSQKVFLLKETEPDVVTNLSLLLSKANRIIIKTSPLFDIQSGLSELQNVSEVHVISVKNDCKELLWVIDKGFAGEPTIHCCAINAESDQRFDFNLSDERAIQDLNFSSPQLYLYEPDVSILKAGAFKSIAKAFDMFKLHKNTHLYTSQAINEIFIGRIFQVETCYSYKAFGKEKVLKKANVIARNFPLSAEELKKRHKIQDGGDDYLVFCTDPKGELLCIKCSRLR